MKKFIHNGIILFLLLFLFFLWGCDGTTPPTNHPPVITSTPVTTATVNVPYSYDVDASDPDGDALTYSLITTVQGMVIDPATGLITWTPTQETDTPVTVEVTDGASTDSQGFTITFQVTPPAVGPVQNITQGTGYATIQEALNAANSGDTIRVSDGLYPESLTFPAGRVIILQSVNGPASTHIEGLNSAFTITCNNSPAGTEITGFHVAHAAGAEGCGIYHTNGSIRISNCNIDHHSSTQGGGSGIVNDNATMTISGCNITLNSNTENGGGIYNYKGTVNIEGASSIAKNHANFYGGGIINNQGTMNILGSTISENTAELGAGLYNMYGTLTISGGSIISENVADAGGGIYNADVTLNISGGSVISGNVADAGGGIYNMGALNISGGSIISENVAYGQGGGIYDNYGTLTVQASTISENSAAVTGGGIYIYQASLTAYLIGGNSGSDTSNFNSFYENKHLGAISPAQHITSINGDVHGNFPNNYYTPQ